MEVSIRNKREVLSNIVKHLDSGFRLCFKSHQARCSHQFTRKRLKYEGRCVSIRLKREALSNVKNVNIFDYDLREFQFASNVKSSPMFQGQAIAPAYPFQFASSAKSPPTGDTVYKPKELLKFQFASCAKFSPIQVRPAWFRPGIVSIRIERKVLSNSMTE